MSGAEAEEVAALARAFARHLEHLRVFRGVHYVGAALIPPSGRAESDESDEPEVERVAEVDDAEPTVEVTSAPEVAAPVAVAPAAEIPAAAETSAAAEASASAEVTPTSAERQSAAQWSAATKLQYLRERNVGDCRRCPLAATRRNIVFGVGDPDADLMFVGEAPGGEEDRRGEPFVGAAGQRLDQWIAHLGLRRDQVYIANVLKCRPPNNRDPKPLEIERCSPFLHAQIRAIEPKILVALGRFAGSLLLGRDLKMYEMRGAVHHYREPKSGAEIPLVVTYHPSYVIRREQEPDARGKPDPRAAIKSEDQKVRGDLERALSLLRVRDS
jgi:uracil-DNA glycosylase family 4